jgi:hypothetical protein
MDLESMSRRKFGATVLGIGGLGIASQVGENNPEIRSFELDDFIAQDDKIALNFTVEIENVSGGETLHIVAQDYDENPVDVFTAVIPENDDTHFAEYAFFSDERIFEDYNYKVSVS